MSKNTLIDNPADLLEELKARIAFLNDSASALAVQAEIDSLHITSLAWQGLWFFTEDLRSLTERIELGLTNSRPQS